MPKEKKALSYSATSDDFVGGQKLVDAVMQYGLTSMSAQVLQPGFVSWQGPNPQDVVPHVRIGCAWVAAGAPLAPRHRQHIVALQFVDAARAAQRTAIFFGLPIDVAKQAGLKHLVVGQEPVWRPNMWLLPNAARRTARAQVRRASKQGVVIAQCSALEVAPTTSLRHELNHLCRRWQAGHALAPMGFVVALNPFDHINYRRFFVARHENNVIAFVSAICCGYAQKLSEAEREKDVALRAQSNRGCWLLEHIVRAPEAPNGTTEALVDCAMRAFVGADFISLGPLPLMGDVSCGLAIMRTVAQPAYGFLGLARFRARLAPETWQPLILACAEDTSWPKAFFYLLYAFVPQGLVAYGWQTLRRGPRPVLIFLALALVPWTAGMAALHVDTWFPSAAVRHFWVSFDVGLTLALFYLAWRPKSLWAKVLAGIISVDVCATFVEAIVYPHPRGIVGAIVRGVAVLAPALAATVLWGAAKRLALRQRRYRPLH